MKHFENVTFTPTQFTTAAEKRAFAEKLAAFVLGGFKEKSFSQKLYKTLRNCFSHIAEYDRAGFYSVWFSDTRAQLDWVVNAMRQGGYGDPAFTHSDVEKAFRTFLEKHDVQYKLTRKISAELMAAEQAQYAALKSKFG